MSVFNIDNRIGASRECYGCLRALKLSAVWGFERLVLSTQRVNRLHRVSGMDV